jgi:hypothetical protein
MTAGDRVKVIISIGGPRAGSIGSAADDLTEAGLSVDSVLESIGAITGSVDRSKLRSLGKVLGVDAIEIEEEMEATPEDPDQR